MALLKKYKAHINVKWCNTSKAIKYLFKYITKGVDKATIVFLKNSTGEQIASTEKVQINEIENYQECRYLSACEAAWRIFDFDIHYQKPAVMKLTIHLEGEQSIIVDENDDLQAVVNRTAMQHTMFTAWMETNVREPFARTLTYIQFPRYYVWDNTSKIWSRRQRAPSIGRIVNINPSAGENYYLRMMINHQKGCKSFEEIRTVGKVTYKTYKESCFALDLLDGDKEWHEAMSEASHWATASQLRELFVTLLLRCEVIDPLKLWNNCLESIGEDILCMQRKRLDFQSLILDDQQVQQYVLIELEKLLTNSDKSLADYPDMPVPEKTSSRISKTR